MDICIFVQFVWEIKYRNISNPAKNSSWFCFLFRIGRKILSGKVNICFGIRKFLLIIFQVFLLDFNLKNFKKLFKPCIAYWSFVQFFGIYYFLFEKFFTFYKN